MHDPIHFDPAARERLDLGFTRPTNNAGGLEAGMTKLLDAEGDLDAYTTAHLTESRERIRKVLAAQLTTTRP